jgi:subtilisin family serine protease
MLALPVAGGPSLRAAVQPGQPDLSLPGDPRVSTASDGTLSRIAPDVLREAQETPAGETVAVIVVSQGPLADTGDLHERVSPRPDANGLTFTAGNVNPSALTRLASASNVIAILSNAPPPIPRLPEPQIDRARGPRPFGGQVPGPESKVLSQSLDERTQDFGLGARDSSPDSWHTADVHSVRDAWAAGYRGNGVKVAVLDSGVDFGHPDLQNTFARVEDPSSPYYGWPYVVDPYSMELMSLGMIHDIPEAIRGYGSWFVDTSTRVSGSQVLFTTVTATPSGMDRVVHTYTTPGNSRSGVYHMGIHPDEHLAFDVYAEYPAVLVADTVTAGVYDTVYVDLNNNYDFRDDAPMRRGSEVATRDVSGDGIADLSAGMLYFIADGRTPIPGSDWLFGLLPPGNGDLVALHGSMNYNEDHGTFCASSVVAQGIVDGPSPLRPPYKPQGVGGMVQGMAPGAKVISIGNIYRSNMAVFNSFVIAALGLDGRPNTGDEPQVASMSFGYSGGWNNGWDYMSRYLLYLSTYNPTLTWLAAAGNGGPGYGTVTPPASSPAVIAVGASTQYGETTTFETISSTDRITWGDVQPWSNRGPSHLGQPRPDVVAVGAWGTGDLPVNMSGRNGSIAYDVWGGTSMSTPVGAGITALVYQAYKARTGVWPSAETVRTLLKSSATDLNYGPFLQGAGMLDAHRAVQQAAAQGGVAVSPSSWVPGSSAPAYMGTLIPGERTSQTFTLQNLGNSAVTARLSAEQLVETSQYEWSVGITNSLESTGDFKRPDYIWSLTSRIPADTDLVRVTAVVSYTDFSASDPTSPFLGASSSWRLLAYDWRDNNRDGAPARDLNGNGVINAGEDQPGELNRLTYGYNINDIVEIEVQKPLERSGDGFIVALQHQIRSNYIPTSNVRLKLTTYRKQDWPFLNPHRGQITIPAGGSATADVEARVPAGTATGAYEGHLIVETGSGATARRILVPVAINVRSNSLRATLGGANGPAATTPYDNGRVAGAQNWGWRPESGEWRHYYLDNPSQPQSLIYLWAGVDWQHYPTDLDVIIGGPTPWDWFSQRFPALYGSHGMDGIAGSAWTNLGGGSWQWRTNTDTTEEWISARLSQQGSHETVLHNVFYSGSGHSEPFTTTLGTVELSQDYVNITSNQTRDSATISFTTNRDIPGLRAQAYGLAQKRTWPNNSVIPLQTWFTDTVLTDLASVEFSTDAPTGINVDMYVDYWENNRYVWLASSTSPTGHEFIRIEPADSGRYRVRIEADRHAPNPARFDFSIKAIGGTDMFVSPSVITDTVRAGTTLTFTVGYDRPSMTDGIWEGRLFLGPYTAPSLHSLPVTVLYGNVPPTPTPSPVVCLSRFTDVPATHWVYPYVNPLYCQGIVSGYLDETFRPGNGASRVQFVKMMVLGMGWPLEHPATPTFTDVSEFAWGYEYVESAVARGAISGYADGTFRPYNPITRGQIVKLLVIAKGWPLEDPPQPSFSDVPRGAAFFNYAETAVRRGIISGYADGTFRPGNGATRGQIAKVLWQAMNAP